MARRFLLIEFDDATQADKLKSQIDEATRRGRGYRVVGLFARPGNDFCSCGSNWITNRSGEVQTRRGPRFGWWVCIQCKKPIPSMSALKNLIPASEIIDPSLTEKGLGFYVYSLSAHSTATKEMNPSYGLAK